MVYVDNASISLRNMVMSHMAADTVEELHEMADKIGLSRQYFQNSRIPHYDVCQAMRRKAISLGAKEVSGKELITLVRK